MYVFFRESLFKFPDHFSDWIVYFSYMSSLSSLEMDLLLVLSLANIFSHSVGCLVVLFMVSFAVQNLLNLMRFHLFILSFYFSLECS